jgi:hypothetical protein
MNKWLVSGSQNLFLVSIKFFSLLVEPLTNGAERAWFNSERKFKVGKYKATLALQLRYRKAYIMNYIFFPSQATLFIIQTKYLIVHNLNIAAPGASFIL